MNATLTIMKLTLYEAKQRRILLATFVGGLAFVLLFGIGFYFIQKDVTRETAAAGDFLQRQVMLNFFIMAGLYAINMLTLVNAALLPVDTLSGEIASGVMQTVASKPIRRSSIVLGKWLAHALVVAGYLALLSGGVLIVARVLSGITPPRLVQALPLIYLGSLVLLTLCMAGGARLSTVTNGVLVFSLYGLAFVGGWTEQIGSMVGNDLARRLGTAVSLLMPGDSMWRLAAWHMQPAMVRDLPVTPFSSTSVPSPAMVVWTLGYIAVTLVVAIHWFRKRAL